MKDIIDLIARICLSTIFIFDAIDSILYFDETLDKMTAYGLVWNQKLLLILGITLMILGGVLLLIGYRTTIAAICLLLYLLPLTFILHSFWNEPPDQLRFQSILFMKNISIMGGLLMVMANPSGRFSVKTLLANTKVPRRFRG